ncbi:AsmA-like C-terminal region-containing protein [Bacteroides fragilis]|jgi:outer membrane assembly protein|uniref:AsmA family protein n=1 Tax=Bacteroides fragilis TaxID=817 RepID=UPI0015F48A36|nr:AsmA family protein [Bacteroides fragilis]MBA5650428.1 AsmA family protein [Bacteroides fragilis]MCE9398964.1 AsmA-like C-terminal region-containing protein [Bacteroides fragilis]MCE9470743.1 AsmA-like C-terminal region-containing protein [Bacteroides fragilis]
MNRQVKKTLKISGITLGTVLLVLLVAIAFVINFIVTPKKLTPVVLDAANQTLNAHLDMESVELTFFSTFPQFGLKVKNGSLVSKALNDSSWCKTDSLLSFKECVLTVNPIAYLTENRIVVHNLSLEEVAVYAYRNKTGKANWEVTRASVDTIPADTASTDFNSEIDIRNIELKHANLVFDDRNTDIYSRIDDANLKLRLSLTKGVSTLGLKFDNKNILFWQQGELLVNKIATSLRTDIMVDRQTAVWKLKDTELDVNGIRLDVNGAFRRDTVAKTIGMDLEYGLHAPSMETVLRMIPKSYVKDSKVSAKGEVTVSGRVRGVYGDKKLPAVSLKIGIKEASAQYKGLPYGIDEVTADFDAYVDLMRHQPSYLNLKIFHFKGAHTEVLADAKVDDLLDDPLITFHTKSTVDLDALAKTFPLQESVTITGKLDADMGMKCRLSTLKKQDIGRMKLGGKLELKDFELKDTAKDFDFLGNATFRFRDNETLQAQMDVRKLVLRSRFLSSDIERLVANVSSTNPQDTNRIVSLQCDMEVSKLRASMGDSIKLYSARAKAQAALGPQEVDVTKPAIDFSLRADSLFFSAAGTRMAMNVAGIKMKADKLNDSLWMPKGIVGFNRLRFRTPEFGLPIRMSKTAVTVDGPKITLKNASVRIGRSNMTATGDMMGVYRAMTKGEKLTAHLSLTSDLIDCNQLINSLSFPEDTTEVLTDSVPSEMKLFVIPRNIDFELQTDLKKVIFEKMLFENVHGAVDIKNQAIHLEDLSMRALDADMKAVMVYKAGSPRGGYAGFDFKIRNINIAKLVDFVPALDTIVPMLRSFKGRVMFDVAADARLDSAMNIRIPTLRSAIHIKGDSLVLMDGETFAEISKMLMFKNKKENVFDSISVNVTVHDGNVTVYPFLVEIDRYKAAVGGEQGLDMNFNYHISILKSPLPFKAGVNISGNLDKMKFRIGKAKYKDAVTPAAVHRVDSTRMNMGNEIVNRFRRVVLGRQPR